MTVSAQQNIVPISHYPQTNSFSPTDELLIAIPGVTNKNIVVSNVFGALLAVSSYGGFSVTTNIGNQLVVTMTNGVATNLTVLGTFTSTANSAAIQSATNNALALASNSFNAGILSATNNALAIATNYANNLGNTAVETVTNSANSFTGTYIGYGGNLTNSLGQTFVGTNYGRTTVANMINMANQFTGIYVFPSNTVPTVTGSNIAFYNSNGVHGFWITLHGTNLAF